MLVRKAFARCAFPALAASILALSGCDRPTPRPPAESTPVASVKPAPPAPPPTLDRAALLLTMDQAASDYATGTAPSGPGLAGRRFSVRQAFGCAGPVETSAEAGRDGLAQWSWSEDHKTIEVRLSPGEWANSPPMAGGGWEAAEGFWLARPWLRSEGCPGAEAGPLSANLGAGSAQSMGVAAVFEEGGSRLGRRNGRAYVLTLRGEGDQPPTLPIDGLRVVLEGRLAAFGDGRAVRCHAASQDQRPVCIAAVQLDRVAFEDADGALLGEWRAG